MKLTLAALALLAACTVERTALMTVEVATPITSCDEAFAAVAGSACDLQAGCSRPHVQDPLCCKEIAICAGGKLVKDDPCDPSCVPCKEDLACPFGKSVCELGRCLACPDVGACAPCPDSWFPRQRNGCPTCDCVPKSECNETMSCGGGVCYRGSVCGPVCDNLSCCANVCGPAVPRCPEPAPLGCAMKCPPELGCDRCVASPCQCMEGKWRCKPVCAEINTVCTHIE